MLSYKQYQIVQESFGLLPVGLGRMPAIGIVGASGASLEEGKK